LPFLAVTANAEVMVGESSDTLAAGFWSINDQIGLVTMFASGLVAFFALVNLAAGFDVDGFAAGLLSSLAIIFSNNSNPDDLIVGSSMSLRISFSLKTSRARMSAEAAMVDREVSAGEIKESLASFNDENRFPSGLIQIQQTLLFTPVPSLIAFQPCGRLW
jgi:hypothetical protein